MSRRYRVVQHSHRRRGQLLHSYGYNVLDRKTRALMEPEPLCYEDAEHIADRLNRAG